MRIQMAHLQDQGINFVVFATDAANRTDAARRALLGQLVAKARGNRLRVDKAALAYHESGGTRFFGTPDLVKYLASRGVPQWTHTLDV
ncbi:MAG: hypothetical protein AB7I50_16730 [Vicinamibacterales bacterium]